ncbi:hypothetical protein Pcinc_033566 [Petrolisthes cinctipes]|uniref:Uncharacterized protein n=1 Tax=Petrolisthes cinctipes TaxID=88211 RepID=A0AAE1ES24_PETCI|nr:hypothetical protein Pcinc_033566 [Petrolisthes cinctipes]
MKEKCGTEGCEEEADQTDRHQPFKRLRKTEKQEFLLSVQNPSWVRHLKESPLKETTKTRKKMVVMVVGEEDDGGSEKMVVDKMKEMVEKMKMMMMMREREQCEQGREWRLRQGW